MTDRMELLLSDYDAALIENHQLGAVIGVYRLKRRWLLFFRWCSGLFFMSGVMILLAILILAILGGNHAMIGSQHPHDPIQEWLLQQEQAQDGFQMDQYFSPLLGGLFGLSAGLLLWYIGIPLAESEHVLVCERGLLSLRKRIKGYRTDAVLWGEILEIKEDIFHLEYLILSQGGREIVLSRYYQQFDELIALVKFYSGRDRTE